MDQQLEIVEKLTGKLLNSEQRQSALLEFARTSGWQPSDTLVEYPGTESISNGHLVAEQGLDRSAVITFLSNGNTFPDLNRPQCYTILSISYNNLIDWHLFPDRYGLTLVFNRGNPLQPQVVRRSERSDLWRVEAFEEIADRNLSSTLKPLDEALIETVSLWRRAIASELGTDIPNHAFAALFNSILLIRAIEDQRRFRGDSAGEVLRKTSEMEQANEGVAAVFRSALEVLRVDLDAPLICQLFAELSWFNSLDVRTCRNLIGDFYSNRFARPFDYDFSLISKQALSKIYEKYVSILRTEESAQLSLFAPLPAEVHDPKYGEIYTPQYIARFFSRYLKEELSPRDFRSLRTIDPACGSGIFLRTIIESQCDPLQALDLDQTIQQTFDRTVGIDIDKNACFASRLSLALLYLVLKGELPEKLRILNDEALNYLATNPDEAGQYDVVIANPPFVKWDNLKPLMRKRIADLLGLEYRGKVDLFASFLVLGLSLLRPGGYLLFVLPHSFLLGQSSRAIRKRLSAECYIRSLVDLSEVPVFEGVGSYVILLIAQKQSHKISDPRVTIYSRIREYVGHALQEVLQRREVSKPSYEVYEVPNDIFGDEPWLVLPKRQQQVMNRLKGFPKLGDLCEIKQGIVTGADSIFIRDVNEIPTGERLLWPPLLGDREITRFRLPTKSQKVVFYPFLNSMLVEEKELMASFPITWNYLKANKQALEKRAPARRGNCAWWAPAWPRKPSDIFGRPKLISPHLSITPRFAADMDGIFAVTRSPMFFARNRSDEKSLLKYVLAILNSSIGFWQILVSSHKYRGGYVMLENKTLTQIRLPEPGTLSVHVLRGILSKVDERLEDKDISECELAIDELVSDAFSFSDDDLTEIGMRV
jgi:tRNA1(Val) A37 N6-methylase TrmN6